MAISIKIGQVRHYSFFHSKRETRIRMILTRFLLFCAGMAVNIQIPI